MITSKILSRKNTILNDLKQKVTDLIYGTFKFPDTQISNGVIIVNEFEAMRPDLVSNRLYGDQNKWDALLKFNGISNPFSLDPGELLYVIPYSDLDGLYVKPTEIKDRPGNNEEDATIQEIQDTRDSRRVDNLRNKNKQLPPNISKKGDESVKIKDGKLVFGEDVTSINKDNCPVPISRTRLKAALIKDRLFL